MSAPAPGLYTYIWPLFQTSPLKELCFSSPKPLGTKLVDAKWELYEYQRSRSVIDLGPNHLHSIFLNFFSSITADFNISSAIRWVIQDQWSSGFDIHHVMKLVGGAKIPWSTSCWILAMTTRFITWWTSKKSNFNSYSYTLILCHFCVFIMMVRWNLCKLRGIKKL